MTEQTTAPERLLAALKALRGQAPELAGLLDSYEPLLLAKGRLGEEYAAREGLPELHAVDIESFRLGMPLTPRDQLRLEGPEVRDVCSKLLPALKQGFPLAAEELEIAVQALDRGLDAGHQARHMLAGAKDEVARTARFLFIRPEPLAFLMAQALTVLASARTRALEANILGLTWLKGYCPICGSWPHLGYTACQDGRRRLICSLCGHDWRFARDGCPYCGNEGQACLESFHLVGREHERAEACHACGNFLPLVQAHVLDDFAPEAALLSLVPLGMLARGQGFSVGSGSWPFLGTWSD